MQMLAQPRPQLAQQEPTAASLRVRRWERKAQRHHPHLTSTSEGRGVPGRQHHLMGTYYAQTLGQMPLSPNSSETEVEFVPIQQRGRLRLSEGKNHKIKVSQPTRKAETTGKGRPLRACARQAEGRVPSLPGSTCQTPVITQANEEAQRGSFPKLGARGEKADFTRSPAPALAHLPSHQETRVEAGARAGASNSHG